MKIKDIGFLKDKEYEILLDDSIQTIKEKFFVMEEFDIKRNPNVLRLVLDNEDVTSYLFKLKKYTDLNQLRDIEIKSLYDEIHNVHNEMHEKNMEDLYTYFKNIYVDLTIEDLEHIYKTSDKTSDKISNKTSDKTPDYV